MKRLFLSLIFLSVCNIVYSQIETPFYGSFICCKPKIIKEDNIGGQYARVNDSLIVYIAKRTVYKLFDKEQRLLVEGNLGGRIFVDYYKRYGKWTEYYTSGKTKVVGYYHADNAVGLWQFYYKNGNLKETYTISFVETEKSSGYCKVGLYQSFYENGQIEVCGFYKSALDTSTIEQMNAMTGDISYKKIITPQGKRFGLWTYYKLNGDVKKTENFGEVTKKAP